MGIPRKSPARAALIVACWGATTLVPTSARAEEVSHVPRADAGPALHLEAEDGALLDLFDVHAEEDDVSMAIWAGARAPIGERFELAASVLVLETESELEARDPTGRAALETAGSLVILPWLDAYLDLQVTATFLF